MTETSKTGIITTFTATFHTEHKLMLKDPRDYNSATALIAFLFKNGWFTTWHQSFLNGVEQYDLINIKKGHVVTANFSGFKEGKPAPLKVRVSARERSGIKAFIDALTSQTVEIHQADVGIGSKYGKK